MYGCDSVLLSRSLRRKKGRFLSWRQAKEVASSHKIICLDDSPGQKRKRINFLRTAPRKIAESNDRRKIAVDGRQRYASVVNAREVNVVGNAKSVNRRAGLVGEYPHLLTAQRLSKYWRQWRPLPIMAARNRAV